MSAFLAPAFLHRQFRESSLAMQQDQEIMALIASSDHEDEEGMGVVAAVDKILARLEHTKLAYRLSVPPRLMGVHPCNRNGYGVSAIEMQALGVKIFRMGFPGRRVRMESLSKHPRRTALQRSPKS